MVIKKWHPPENKATRYRIIALSIIVGLFLVIAATMDLDMSASIWGIILGVGGILIFTSLFFLNEARLAMQHRDFDFMIVEGDSIIVAKAVKQALDGKNFPYVKTQMEFWLKTERLWVKVITYSVKGSGVRPKPTATNGSKILIGPISKENFEVAQSLKANIEGELQL